MVENDHVDLDYFADVDFDLTMAELMAALERFDGTTEEYGLSDTTGSRRYDVGVSFESTDEGEFGGLEFVSVDECERVEEDAEFLIAEIEVSYVLPEKTDTYAPPDTFVVRFTNDGFEVFTDDHYLRTSPTELFELLKVELEVGP